ncbi:MAG: hypothetical protein HY530_04810 [Chloroflexi bacterium]|nr:hypothetical protein [Chloroflexota bacterium]
MKKLPLEEKVAPIRERRTGAIRAYMGTARQLLADIKSGKLKACDRAFTNTWTCSSSIMAGPIRMATVSDGVVIMHSPMGCISNLSQFLAPGLQPHEETKQDQGGYTPNQPATYYCSNLTEEEVIFGAEKKLRETIIVADKRHHPKSIWIFTSCVSGIMGDDIEGVVKETQAEVGATIVPIRCEAFQSRICQWGHDSAGHAILKYLVKKPEKKRNDMINMMASTAVWAEDRIHLAELLGKVGIQCNTVPDYAVTESFRILSEAACSVALCPTWSDYLGKGLEQEYGIPYVRDILPLGTARTEQWLRKIAVHCGKEEEMEQLIKEERAAVMPRIEALRKQWQGMKVFVSCGITRSLHLPHMLVNDFGMELVGINPFEFDEEAIVDLENLLKLTGGKDFLVHVSDCQTLEMANYIKKLDVDLFLGHRGSVGFIFKHGVPGLRVGVAYGSRHGLRRDMDSGRQMGFSGVLSYARYLDNVIKNPSFSEKLSAHTRLPFKESWYEQDPTVNMVDPL